MHFSTLEVFGDALKAKFSLPGSASPEDQLKPVVADLFKSAGAAYGLTVETRTETHLSEHKVRPDIAVYVGGLICGYIELKAPGLGADAPKLKGDHNKKQWEKLKALPNLIYTDGREWALYRTGERPDGQPVVRLHDDPTDKGKNATTEEDAEGLEKLFRDFLGWQPSVPHNPSALAKYLAPVSRFLRSEVENALEQSGSAVDLLANEWRQFFFPDADNAKFADAYAQTVTYAMLLARLSGATKLDPIEAAKTLDKNNGLLARTLELLGQPEARKELSVGFELLQRSLEALNPHDFLKSKPDLWLYFYEDFLAAYDPKLRKDYGVYYTPREVVELQVRLASELLEKRFGKKLGFADDGVVFLDPAVGTGTYPVAAVKHGLEKVRARSGPGAVPARARQMAENMHGFEVLVGPYAVAHLRLTQALEGAMNDAKAAGEPEEKLDKRLNIYLADTLESPNAAPPGGLTLTYRALTHEHEAARKVKQGGDILVCLGNPPYDRQTIEEGDTTTQRKGGWVRFGDQVKGAAKQEEQGERAIFKDFTQPATRAGAGVHLKNLYNDYVYFWRWALWRLFEQQKCGGVVTFITASSYLAGPGFIGVREVMRRTFDDLWIIDLGGDNLGTRKTPNVFNIQTPVAIAIGMRGSKPSRDTPAKVHYAKIDGATREDKLTQLEGIANFDGIAWRDCPDDWHTPFLPIGQGDFASWPEIESLFPLALNGAQFKRHWPIGETVEVLRDRWDRLVSSKQADRKKLFRETGGWKITKIVRDDLPGQDQPSIFAADTAADMPAAIPFSYRPFDRHFALYDFRLGDRLRPTLWRIHGASQVYFTSLLSNALGFGQGIVACSSIPDLHHFRGSFGGKDVIPLYRDAAGTEPNLTGGLLEALGHVYGTTPTAEDFAAYVYAVLGGQSFTRRFWNELETPGPRIPVTKDGKTFSETAKLGCKLIWLHTYAERFRGEDRGDEVVQGKATTIKGVSSDPARYPEAYGYDPAEREVYVGDGRFGPVAQEVWEFEVSGLKVVQSWLGYRMKKRGGKKSSPLDDIRPERWTARMSDELLELLWVLEATLAMEPELKKALDNVVAGPCFTAAELPTPRPEERVAPGTASAAGGLLELMGIEDDDASDDDEEFAFESMASPDPGGTDDPGPMSPRKKD
ncbi:type ISP restriction/modification enzyme [Rhizobium phaseoli]|uniref:type ISP restriction/modification enzyme n=1 Tax=Rhizobium phaseoli TaxID=396 RepID=UPI0011420231|nr:type ISP restriction/modification enzyme [Rhizobium phaseoli]